MEIMGKVMVISESEGRDILEPYQDYIAEGIWQGWDQYFIKYANTLHEHTRGDRAALINSQINIAIRAIFMGRQGARLHSKPHGQYWLFIRERIGIRFKKLSNSTVVICPARVSMLPLGHVESSDKDKGVYDGIAD